VIYYQQGNATIHNGDCLDVLRTLPDESVHCCVTSPPYWGLRDYGHDGQIGLEETPEAYVSRLVEVFREVRRVLRSDGTLWLNLGDSYAAGGMSNPSGKSTLGGGKDRGAADCRINRALPDSLKPKDLVGIPWRVAFALQADGWWLRQDIIWHKPNPMPESVTDRCTKAHEYVFLLAKSQRYYYDAEAISEDAKPGTHITTQKSFGGQAAGAGVAPSGNQIPGKEWSWGETRNRRSVWTVCTKPYSGAHFAVMPPDLVKPCIMAGTSAEGCCAACGAPWQRVVERERVATRPGTDTKVTGDSMTDGNRDPQRHVTEVKTVGWERTCECDEARVSPCTVLDPFNGAATVGLVSLQLQRRYIGIELNPDYCKISVDRINMEARQKRLFAASGDS
jgi:DNA modification methylase